MKFLSKLVVSSIVLTLLLSNHSVTNATQLPTIYWGATLYGRAPDSYQFQPGGQFYNFETTIAKKKMAIISWGAPWEYPTGTMLRFQRVYFDNVRAHGSIPMLNWGSFSTCCGINQPRYKLSNITRGDFDAFITQWATDAKAWGHPFFLRFDHEMNGYWQFPWSAQGNGNTPTDYINAWRHVHAIFDRVGAKNVTWVWCPNISGPKIIPMAQVYPGDAYVDWIALDGYNFYKQGNMPWFSFAQVYSGDTKVVSNSKDSYTEITQLAKSKPLMIAEFASIEAGDGGVLKAAWITQALLTDIPTKYPRIRAIVWFNWDVSSNLTWAVESSTPSKTAFAQSINSMHYASNTFGNLSNTKIQPLSIAIPLPVTLRPTTPLVQNTFPTAK